VHNSIPEYASTTSISTVMTMTFHIKPFEKKVFKEVIFPQISLKAPSRQETEHRTKREKKY
jgi:hypothetical protein